MSIREYCEHYFKSQELFEQKNYHRAIKEAKKGLKIEDKIHFGRYHYKLMDIIGDSYAKIGEYGECNKWWKTKDEEYLGYKFFRLGIYDEAKAHYSYYLKQNLGKAKSSKIAVACSRLGEIYLYSNKPKIAYSFLKIAKDLGQYSKRAYKKALQLSEGNEKKNDLVDLVHSASLVEETYSSYVNINQITDVPELLKAITKTAKNCLRKYNLNDSRHLWKELKVERSDLWGQEIRIVDKYWKKENLSRLKEQVKETRWSLCVSNISEYIFDQQCLKKIKEDLRLNGLRGYISSNYYKHKMNQNNIRMPKPRYLRCRICRRRFLEVNSIKELEWKYCYRCTLSAYRGAFKKNKSKRQMKQDLQELVERLEYIPPQTYMNLGYPSRDFWSNLNKEKIHEIMPIMVKILPSKVYVLKYGSWLQALKECGIIEGVREGVFGYICLAEDGHECLSMAEKIIDDWLYRNNIEHNIEPYYPFDKELNPNVGLRADWKIDGCLIEFFGLCGMEEYDLKVKEKQEIAMRHDVKLISIFPDDLYSLDSKLSFLKENK
jgi:hypothetical protein